ncbi:MAG: SUF system Fe-S cluster assembly protein [Hyphomicrobium sp.]|nr:MAG: SUF system Fe-S cluster assembly protein [Hyphomicrobium sp.]PPD01980.1 MAG: SUF system Fe-S cluster assembly protein [Hyphomicrobium sp.]
MDNKPTDDRTVLKEAAAALDDPAPAIRDVSAETAENDVSATPALPPEEIDRLTTDIVAALKTVHDPEIPSDIYELGLIYRVEIDDDRQVTIDMTLTAPGCPVAGEMPIWVENAVNAVPGVAGTKVKLTFDPPWDQSRMSDEAKLAVGMF